MQTENPFAELFRLVSAVRNVQNGHPSAPWQALEELDHLIDNYGRDQFSELGVDLATVQLNRPVGCEECGGTGYKGRTGIHELLVGTHELRKMIYNKADLDSMRLQALKDGMRTLKQDGINKIFMGLSDYKQLLGVVAE